MFYLILAVFISPYAEHSFMLEAIRKLYVAKTTQKSLFQEPVSEKHVNRKAKKRKLAKKFSKKLREELNQTVVPKVSLCDGIILFWERFFGCTGGKLGKLMDIGTDRMEGEFNIVHITKQLRNLKLMLRE